jgi:hypothetical protein
MDNIKNSPVAVLDMCCGGKKCPVNTLHVDGSLEVFDAETGSQIVYTAEQREQLRMWLNGQAHAAVVKGT